MINNREIALSIQKGKRYLNHLNIITAENHVSYDQLIEVANQHKLHENIAQGFLLSGVLIAYYVTESSIEAEQAIQFEAGKSYRIYWAVPITDELAFHVVAASVYVKRIEAYERFARSNPQRKINNCVLCEQFIPIKRTDGFCSDGCKVSFTKSQEIQNLRKGFKENLAIKLKAVRDFFKTFNLL